MFGAMLVKYEHLLKAMGFQQTMNVSRFSLILLNSVAALKKL
jgi:hypothetical protein